MTISVNYQKRKNINLFNKLQTNKNINHKNLFIRVLKERTKNTLKQLLTEEDNIC